MTTRNYETYLLDLWVNNDQETYTFWRFQAMGETLADLAAMMQDHYSSLAEDVSEPFFVDLINAALGSVDWEDVAEAFVDEDEDEDD